MGDAEEKAKPSEWEEIKARLKKLYRDPFWERPRSFYHVRQLTGLLISEMIGTAVLMITLCRCAYNADHHIINTIAFGVIMIPLQVSVGPSGGVLNPALNLGLMVLGHMSIIKCLLYTLFQMIGGIAGTAIAYAIRPMSQQNIQNYCCVKSYDSRSEDIFFLEFVWNFFLGINLAAIADARILGSAKRTIPVVFGMIFHIIIYTVHPLPMGVNPARVGGPAFLWNRWNNIVVAWCGELCGAGVSTFLYTILADSYLDKSIRDTD